MNYKITYLKDLSRHTAEAMGSHWRMWTGFLEMASRLYRYPYPDQLLIYAQRPAATACASYEVWNERMFRYVKRGSRGIALLGQTDTGEKIRYVYDITDTGTRKHARDIHYWQIGDSDRERVAGCLEKRYGIGRYAGLPDQLSKAAAHAADAYLEQNMELIREGCPQGMHPDMFMEDFKILASTSITYVLMARCGMRPELYFGEDAFRELEAFADADRMVMLGTTVSTVSCEILIEIRNEIRRAERERRNGYGEQDRLYTGGRLSDSGTDAERHEEVPHREVRQDEEGIPSGTQTDPVQSADSEGGTVLPSGRDRPGSGQETGTADGPVPEDRSGTGQSSGSDEMGAAYEPSESTGGGSDHGGAYHQLSLDLFPTEKQQIEMIEKAESMMPFAFSVAQNELDDILRTGSNTKNSRMMIVTEYMKQKSVEELAGFLKTVYHGGVGIRGEKRNLAVWYAEEGILVAVGRRVQAEQPAACIPWTEAAARIGQLLEEGRFATNVELEEAGGFERKQLASSLWYLVRDLSETVWESGYLSSVREGSTSGYPEGTEYIAEQLADKQHRKILQEEYRTFLDAYRDDRSLLRFHYHKVEAIMAGLEELDLPRRTYRSSMAEIPLIRHFITEDEISREMTGGSGFERGRERIAAFFSEQAGQKERADFLKNEYGTGGHSHALSGADGSWQNHDSRGLVYEKENCEAVRMSWMQVAARVGELIRDGQYLLDTEGRKREEISALERAKELINTFCQKEYGSEADLSDLKNVGLAYTTMTDQEISIQVNVDLTEYRLEQYLDGSLLERRQYASLEELIKEELEVLEVLDFDDLIRVESEALERAAEAAYGAEPEQEESQPEEKMPVDIPASNFRIMDDNLGEGDPRQKYARNVAAIRLLYQLEEENRNATLQEQEILSGYVGWGSLADAFDPEKTGWAEEYHTLKELLPEEEYTAARASTLNAHYTSPVIIRAIYEAVRRMGFVSGNILEPSMGVGNFFGLLPEAMQDSRLYGVELDPVSGRIAKKLYPKAEITVAGFETTDRRDFYDLAVGNVPFGNYRVSDRKYDRLGFSIHNYFFAKALDQVRPGGLVAFVTSRYTMDAKNPQARRYLARRAKLLGAVRLPNDAFLKNAGAEVVSDILFLQKREHPIDIEPDWVHLDTTEEGFVMNQYFVQHSEMVLGEPALVSGRFGTDELTVKPMEGKDLADLLNDAVARIHGEYQPAAQMEADFPIEAEDTIPADQDVRNFSYAVVNGEVYFRENSVMHRVELNEKTKARVSGMVELRRIVNELITYQMEDYPDEEIRKKQEELDQAYDVFTAQHGLINNRANSQVFSDDSSYYLLCSLENLDEDGKLHSKADMFTKRTIRPERGITRADTPEEALAVSIGEKGKVDLQYMSELLGKPGEYEQVTEGLRGVIFHDPAAGDDRETGWQTADEYLSGNVRNKLRVAELAAKQNPAYLVNVEALKKAQPKDLDASEIDVRLGATWIEPRYIQQFMYETFETPYYLRRNIEVLFSKMTAEWRITGKSSPGMNDVAAYVTYGTDRANAYRILEETLNLKDIRIYDTVIDAEGKEVRVLNKKETTLAQQKQQAIKDAFQEWIWRAPERRQDLVQTYNEVFNSTRSREYDGSHIRFVGMNPDICLREHQKNAIAHVLYGGNTLLAHEVGAGKTFEMAAAAMESKRLGLCQKSLFVVPNHLTLQWANEFLRLYPSANLLVASKKDFETANRKKFCARIAAGDYDAVIIGHSQFERIPLSTERQEKQLREQIDEIENALAELKYRRGENFTIKQMEKTRKSLQVRLDKLRAIDRKDDVITFEQLGVDRLFVDESHSYKNLFLYTKMRNVAGLSTSEAQKSSDMFMKCRYMDELTGGRGVIFATGTPVSNSMTELYTVMRYLQYGTLQKKGLTHFDCWASTFGETTTAIELAPEGTGYRARTRFSKFFNLPELMNMFKEVADIKTSDQLNLPVPKAEFKTVVVQPSEIQKEMVAGLSERAAAVHSGAVDPSDDNMLLITSDGRKIGLDQRLMNPELPDEPGSKLNVCVENIFQIWKEGETERLTQLVFCDLSTPKNDGTFNVYDDVKGKLTEKGVPADEVAFIHHAETEVKKKELFAKVRNGQVRVLIGSTAKMGAGTNVQDRLIAVHHLDVGWRPSDMTQRNGRIIRQGNHNPEVQIYQYVTENTFDAYLFQTLENKQKFISQIMTSKSPVRSCDDVDEQALSYAEIKALCAGNPLIREKMDLDIDVAKLKLLKADHQSKKYRMEDMLIRHYPAQIELQKRNVTGYEADVKTAAAHPQKEEGFCGMEIGGIVYMEKKDAGEMILARCSEARKSERTPLGSYRGFQTELFFDALSYQYGMVLKGEMSYSVLLGSDVRGNLVRIDNCIVNIPVKLEEAKAQLENLYRQQAATEEEVKKSFAQEEELVKKSRRLAELDAMLNLEESGGAGNLEARNTDQEVRGRYRNHAEENDLHAAGGWKRQPGMHGRIQAKEQPEYER